MVVGGICFGHGYRHCIKSCQLFMYLGSCDDSHPPANRFGDKRGNALYDAGARERSGGSSVDTGRPFYLITSRSKQKSGIFTFVGMCTSSEIARKSWRVMWEHEISRCNLPKWSEPQYLWSGPPGLSGFVFLSLLKFGAWVRKIRPHPISNHPQFILAQPSWIIYTYALE